MSAGVIPILLVLLSVSTIHSLFPVSERNVIIRIDDIQDYGQPSPYAEPEKKLLDFHITNYIPALLSIIPTRFEKDPQLIDQIKEGINTNIFTVAMHGWHHENFSNLSRTLQIEKMKYGKNRLEAALGIQILSFVPPYDKFNQDTIEALKRNSLTLMSSATFEGDIPREEDEIVFIPQTVTTALVSPQTDTWTQLPLESIIKQIEDSWASYGVAVIVIHPRQFISENDEDRWETYTQLFKWIRANNGKVIKVEPPKPKLNLSLNFDPLMISVGLFTGMVSTILIALNLSSKRRDKPSSNKSTF